jgi:hypothetical protein
MELVFSRSNEPLLATVTVSTGITSAQTVLDHIKLAITKWANNTSVGEDAMEMTCSDFNIGDLDGYYNDPTLVPYLVEADVSIVSIEVTSAVFEFDYDTLLYND